MPTDDLVQTYRAPTRPPIRQWFSRKTTGEKLDLVFQNTADDDGQVETLHHLGGRDFLVCYSKPVKR